MKRILIAAAGLGMVLVLGSCGSVGGADPLDGPPSTMDGSLYLRAEER